MKKTKKSFTVFVCLMLDVTVKDFEAFEKETIKILSSFINNQIGQPEEQSEEYLDELRFRNLNKRSIFSWLIFR